MWSFLLLLLVIFLVWPLVKGWLIVHRIRKQAREAFRRTEHHAEDERRNHRPGGWSDGTPRRRRRSKVFSPDEGEYVEWEEVNVDEHATVDDESRDNTSRADSAADTRIVDVEWEDVKSSNKR